MRALRCCVVDDDPKSVSALRELISSSPVCELAGCFYSAAQATKTVLTEDVSAVFVAAEMASMSGAEFAKILPPAVKVVFVASTPKYAYDAFKVNAVDYLLKPVKESDFIGAVNRMLPSVAIATASQPAENKYLIVKSDYKLLQIPLADILFIEGLKDYVKIYLAQDQKSVMTLMSMRMLERFLPPSMFMRIHRSYIINLTHLRMIERARVVFGSHYLPISESYKGVFNEYVAAHSVQPVAQGDNAD